MNKKECEIVKDLFPGYVEKTLRKGTNKFVEKHVETCEDCKKILDMLEEEKESEKKKEEEEKKVQAAKEIDYLKKYNKRIKILEIIAVVLAIFIVLAWTCEFIVNKDIYKKGQVTYDIIQTAYKNMKNFNDEKNYILEIEEITNGREAWGGSNTNNKYYYKEGKYKEEITHETGSKDIYYGPIELKGELMMSDFYNVSTWNYPKDEPAIGIGNIYIIEGSQDLKMIYFNLNNRDETDIIAEDFKLAGLGHVEAFPYTRILSELSPKLCAYLKLEEQTYEGKECYVVKSGRDGAYQEIWIDKEEMLVVREIGLHKQRKCKWEKGTVTDEDVSLKSFEEYKELGYQFDVEDWAKKLLP